MDEEELAPDEGEAIAADDLAEGTDQGGEQQHAEPEVTVDGLASTMGWTPQDKWRGDPDKWKPAHEFLRRTVDVNRTLADRLKGVESQVSNMARTSATMTEHALAVQREKLLAEREEAFEIADKEAFDEVEAKLAKLPSAPAVIPPEVSEFVARNPWFESDADAKAWATSRSRQLADQGIGMAKQLAIVEREAKTVFPELFEEEQSKPKPAPLSKPGNRGAQVQARGFSALPEEAKQVALDYERRGHCTKDEYAKVYFEENA